MALEQSNNHKFASGELVTATKLNNVKVVQTDTDTNNAGFTGSAGQLTYDTTNDKLIIHDGATAGGNEVSSGSGGVANSAVTTAKIADGNVTTAKIANDAVTTDKIADDAVTVDMMHPDFLDPSGGLEFAGTGLKIATSETALSVILRLNASTGVAYNPGTTHIARESDQKTVSDKFVGLVDAYLWLNNNISSTGVTIDIIVETNITESTSSNYHVRTTDDRIGLVRMWSQGLYDNLGTPSTTQITPPVVTINVDQNSSFSSRFIFWFGNTTTIRGIHFIANYGSKGGEYHAFARALGCRLSFIYCKITITSSVATGRVLESINNGLMRVTSDIYASSVNGHEDPFTNGGRAHALELDLVGCQGGVSQVFDVSNQSSIEIVEFRAGVDRDLSGLHFSGSGTQTFNMFCLMNASSRININTKLSRNSGTTIVSPHVFDGAAYNSLAFDEYTEQGTTTFTKMPGSLSFPSTFTTPADHVISADFSVDGTTGPIADVALDVEPDYF
ncbi:putative tail fiber protein [uncultured Mediterranean phage uvMED]|nr:putative tail fiber protein [uncultured Mediterranean phage uvMED]